MKKLLLALLFLWATPAFAVGTNRYVKDGTGVTSGQCTDSTTSNRCTLAYANTIAVPGDVIHMRAGTYTVQPRPTSTQAVNNTGPNYIEYRGDPNDPNQVRFSSNFDDCSLGIETDWLKLYSMWFQNSLNLNVRQTSNNNVMNSVYKRLRITGRLFLMGQVNGLMDSCTVDTFTTGSPRQTNWLWVYSSAQGCNLATGNAKMENTTISNCTFNLNTGQQEANFDKVPLFYFQRGNQGTDYPSRNRFINNIFNITWNGYAGQTAGQVRGVYFVSVINDTFRLCTFNLRDNSPASFGTDDRVMFRMRDYVQQLYFDRCTWNISGRTGNVNFGSEGTNVVPCKPAHLHYDNGVLVPGGDGSWVGDNRWDNCNFNWNAGQWIDGPGIFTWNVGACSDTIQGCIFRGTQAGVDSTQTAPLVYMSEYGSANGSGGPTVIRHNTFMSTAATAPLLQIGDTAKVNTSLVINNNIFYSSKAGTAAGTGSGMMVKWVGIGPTTEFVSRNNLFYFKPKTSTDGDRSIGYQDCDPPPCGSVLYSPPGSNTPWNLVSQGRGDGDSRYGTPHFVDTLLTGNGNYPAYFNVDLTNPLARGFSDARPSADSTYALFGVDGGFAGARNFRKLYTFRPYGTSSSNNSFTTTSPGTKVLEGYQNAAFVGDVDSLSNPKVYMSDSLSYLRIGSSTRFINQFAETVAESLAWREKATQKTNSRSEPLGYHPPTSSFVASLSDSIYSDSTGVAWTWDNLQFVTDYGPRITATWAGSPSADSSLTLFSAPYLEVWGWPRQGFASYSPNPSLVSYSPCNNGLFTLTSGGTDSTAIPDSTAFARKGPTVEIIAYDPRAQFRRSWFDGTLGTISDSAVVIYRAVPATRVSTFTTAYTLPTTSSGFHLLRTRTTDGDGDWRYNNWVIGQPTTMRSQGGSEGAQIRRVMDAATSQSSTVNVQGEYGSSFTSSNTRELIVVLISKGDGTQTVNSVTWGGAGATFQTRHSDATTGVCVEYWIVDRPLDGSSVPYSFEFNSTVDANVYFIKGTRVNPLGAFATSAFSTGTGSTSSVPATTSCGNRFICVTATSTMVGQTMGASYSEGVIDLSLIGTLGPTTYYISAGTAASGTTTVSHSLSASSDWFSSIAVLAK